MQEMQVQSLGWKDPLAKEMAPHSSILAWKIPWTEEPCRLLCPRGPKESDTTERLDNKFREVWRPGRMLAQRGVGTREVQGPRDAELELPGGPASPCFHKKSGEKNLTCAAMEGLRPPPWSFQDHWMKSDEQVCL